MSETYKKLTYNSNKVQVESAIRDGEGVKISTNYAKKATTLAGYGITDGVSLESVYPVGSIYMNASNSTNPATLLGFGTWSALAPGRVLLGAGTGIDSNSESKTFTAGTETGEYDHTLSTTEMPSHGHSVSVTKTNTNHVHGGTTGNMSANASHYHKLYVYTGGQQGISNVYGYSLPASNMGNADSRAYADKPTYDGSTTNNYIQSTSVQHTHSFTTNAPTVNTTYPNAQEHTHTVSQSNAGGGGTHNNVQPSLVVYMWVRTA